jgi:hypothetical protein
MYDQIKWKDNIFTYLVLHAKETKLANGLLPTCFVYIMLHVSKTATVLLSFAS